MTRMLIRLVFLLLYSPVRNCLGKNGTVYQVLLDQTLFFPEEGGQSVDTGILGDVNVLDVQIKGGIITHTLDKKPLSVGASVTGKVDWQHRFFNMQQHNLESTFSGLVHKYFGFDNVGFHLATRLSLWILAALCQMSRWRRLNGR